MQTQSQTQSVVSGTRNLTLSLHPLIRFFLHSNACPRFPCLISYQCCRSSCRTASQAVVVVRTAVTTSSRGVKVVEAATHIQTAIFGTKGGGDQV